MELSLEGAGVNRKTPDPAARESGVKTAIGG
jgi:hypothetical protein